MALEVFDEYPATLKDGSFDDTPAPTQKAACGSTTCTGGSTCGGESTCGKSGSCGGSCGG